MSARAPWPALALVLNALVWGTSWWPFRALEARGLHPLWTTVIVYVLAVALIGALRPRAFARLARTPALWVLVVASGSTNAAFNWAVTIGDVMRVVLLFYLMPLWAVLLARLLLHEPFTRLALLRVALALAGALIVLGPAEAAGWNWAALPLPHSLPDWLGLAGGFCFALNNVMLRRLAAEPEESRALAMFIGGALVAGVLAGVLASHGHAAWPPLPRTGWVAMVLVLALLFLASNAALQYGASRLPANTTAVIMLSEVLFSSVSAAWWGDARFTPPLLIGGALIVLAASLAAFMPTPGPRLTIAAHPRGAAMTTPNESLDTTAGTATTTVGDFEALSITGQPVRLSEQHGKVLLIVNTASACGFTPQFAGLEALWQRYGEQGLVVLGFPSNEFGGQDPGADSEIASFCQLNYGVSFPMMAKVKVNGTEAHPLWQWLKGEKPGILGTEGIKWNFTKFLVGRDGQVLKRYAPTDKPESLAADIEKALQA